MRNPKNLTFWDDLVRFVVRVYRFSGSLPKDELYNLSSQVRRAAVSIRLNLVEGAACESASEYARFLEMAYRSSREALACIELAVELELSRADLVADLVSSGDRLAGAIFAYRRSVLTPDARSEGRKQKADSRMKNVLLQLDSDPQPSAFDRIVALDAGADEVLSYGAVRPESVQSLVHGAIFTRGPKDLKRTAIFIGGSDVAAGERLLEEVRRHMLPQFGLRVSVMLDANGANTTAAAAVCAVARHLELEGACALVLASTGPVGQRVVRLLASQGADVRAGSRQRSRAEAVCQSIRAQVPGARLEPVAITSPDELQSGLAGRALVVSAGAAGVVLFPRAARLASKDLRVAIDLNAIPPLGIEGVEVGDKAVEREGTVCYGAIGVGGTKMKIHKAAITRLFEASDQILDAEEIFALAPSASAK